MLPIIEEESLNKKNSWSDNDLFKQLKNYI